jgi:hypothetical protein
MAAARLAGREYRFDETADPRNERFRDLLRHPDSIPPVKAEALSEFSRGYKDVVKDIWKTSQNDWRDEPPPTLRGLVQADEMARGVATHLGLSTNEARMLIGRDPMVTAFACFIGAIAQPGLREKYSRQKRREEPDGMDLLQLPYTAIVDTFVTGDGPFLRKAKETAEVLASFGMERPRRVVTFAELRESLHIGAQ